VQPNVAPIAFLLPVSPYLIHNMPVKSAWQFAGSKETPLKARETAEQFVKFVLCGLLNSSISYAVFFALYRFVGIHHVPAAAIGYSAGTLNSFLLNRAFTFRARGAVQPMMLKFALVTGAGISTNVTTLHIFVMLLGLPPEYAQIFALLCSGCVNFWGNKLYTFKPVPVESEA
jgi:putative flippase GtrA